LQLFLKISTVLLWDTGVKLWGESFAMGW